MKKYPTFATIHTEERLMNKTLSGANLLTKPIKREAVAKPTPKIIPFVSLFPGRAVVPNIVI